MGIIKSNTHRHIKKRISWEYPTKFFRSVIIIEMGICHGFPGDSINFETKNSKLDIWGRKSLKWWSFGKVIEEVGTSSLSKNCFGNPLFDNRNFPGLILFCFSLFVDSESWTHNLRFYSGTDILCYPLFRNKTFFRETLILNF